MAAPGHHRVLLGMAPGVGKTYRMLREGQAELAAGHDVVIGYLEPHDRPETSAQAEGLEMVARSLIEHGSTSLPEMDLDAVLARAPEIALVDELAHTNASGSEHKKRYEDVEVLLAHGIDVISTVNVQHLESLNDQVADLTGVRVRETLPDDVLKKADEVVLIDQTPEDLIERLRNGKVYPEQRVAAALNSFFRIENLSALREVALRQVAEEVGSKRRITTESTRPRDRLTEERKPQAFGEKLLALITPDPRSQRLIRRAWRSSQRLGASLDLLWVAPSGQAQQIDLDPEVIAMERLASVLGANLIIESGDDLVMTTKRVAQERGATYILIGPPRPRTGFRRLSPSLVDRLLEAVPGVDIRVVSDRSRIGEHNE
ncbi:MAG: histidine kinase [Solirubrobacterales bacterium]